MANIETAPHQALQKLDGSNSKIGGFAGPRPMKVAWPAGTNARTTFPASAQSAQPAQSAMFFTYRPAAACRGQFTSLLPFISIERYEPPRPNYLALFLFLCHHSRFDARACCRGVQ